MYTLQQLAAALSGRIENDHVRCAGPGHSSKDDSLIVWPADTADGFTFNSHACDPPEKCRDYVAQRLAQTNSNTERPKARARRSADQIAAMLQGSAATGRGKLIDSYHYTDAVGTVLYEVLRYEPKSFQQRRPDGKGGQIWNLNGTKRVPYRLHDLIQYPHPSKTLYVTEGEKDCDRLWELGLLATTAQGSKWTDDCVQVLADRLYHLLILEDNDDPGRKKALDAAKALYGVADSIRIVRLPGLGEGGDVSNWLDAGHTRQEFLDFCNAVPCWHPGDDAVPSPIQTNETPKSLEKKTPEIIALSYFCDLKEAPAKLWLIKNVIARGETSSWIAPPGFGKSALLTDISVHGAAAISWRGYRIKQQFGVLYFALERVDLVKRRLIAHRMRDDLPNDLPIAISGRVVDLMSRHCADNILTTIKQAEDHFSREIGLVVIDTYAKGIAAGGGDESAAKDQNAVLANLRRVIDKASIHIATIGHTGKDESKGERGSNAKLADVDLQVQISGDRFKTAVIKKANDQTEGPLTSFRLEQYEFGADQDGDSFHTFILSKEIVQAAEISRRPLTAKQRLAVEALIEAILNHGLELPATYGISGRLKAVTADQWRDELYRRGILDPDVRNPRARFNELRDQLAAKRTIGVRDGLHWLVRGEESPK